MRGTRVKVQLQSGAPQLVHARVSGPHDVRPLVHGSFKQILKAELGKNAPICRPRGSLILETSGVRAVTLRRENQSENQTIIGAER